MTQKSFVHTQTVLQSYKLCKYKYLWQSHINETLCVIWYHLYKLYNLKNTYGRALILIVTLLSLVFLMLFQLYKWYQIAQSIKIFSFQSFHFSTKFKCSMVHYQYNCLNKSKKTSIFRTFWSYYFSTIL